MNIKHKFEKAKKQNEKLLKMIAEEREKAAGYEEIAKLHSAYIAILLNKLGAQKDSGVLIKSEEIRLALEKYEIRATQSDGGLEIYCAAINED